MFFNQSIHEFGSFSSRGCAVYPLFVYSFIIVVTVVQFFVWWVWFILLCFFFRCSIELFLPQPRLPLVSRSCPVPLGERVAFAVSWGSTGCNSRAGFSRRATPGVLSARRCGWAPFCPLCSPGGLPTTSIYTFACQASPPLSHVNVGHHLPPIILSLLKLASW